MPSQPKTAANRVTPYQFFMLSLCLWALAGIAASSFLRLSASTQAILDYADTAACGLFFLDFLHSLYRAPAKLKYLATWGWIDLLSSIPAVGALRWGRAARVVRLLRVMRGLKAARAMAGLAAAGRAQAAFFVTALVSLLLVVFASLAILKFEVPAAGNIKTAEDAMWWAISTMTTVGYGDTFPITSQGRLVGVFLMVAGMGMLGVLSGLAASWFLSPVEAEETSELQEIRDMLKELQASAK